MEAATNHKVSSTKQHYTAVTLKLNEPISLINQIKSF